MIFVINVKTKSDFSRIEARLKNSKDSSKIRAILDKYGKIGIERLRSATPMNSGKTAKSWSYTIEQNGGKYSIQFDNSNIVNGVNIAIIIQYGHGTRNGGYVQGIDYINPALKQTFEELQNELVKEVGRL